MEFAEAYLKNEDYFKLAEGLVQQCGLPVNRREVLCKHLCSALQIWELPAKSGFLQTLA